MTVRTKANGVWKDVSQMYTKAAGDWKIVTGVWTKVNGAWESIQEFDFGNLNLRTTTLSYNRIVWRWDTVANATKYTYQTRTGNGAWSAEQTTTNTSLTQSNRSENTSYSIRVKSTVQNADGDYTTLTRTTPYQTPSQPGGLTFSRPSTTSLTFSWAASSPSNGLGYEWRFKLASASNWTTGSTTSRSVTRTNLTTGASYDFEVRAQRHSSARSAYASITASTLVTPSVPSSLTASRRTPKRITWQWGASTPTSGLGYEWRFKRSSASGWTTGSTTSRSITRTGLNPNTSYDFEVRAQRNNAVRSAYAKSTVSTRAQPSSRTWSSPGTYTYTWGYDDSERVTISATSGSGGAGGGGGGGAFTNDDNGNYYAGGAGGSGGSGTDGSKGEDSIFTGRRSGRDRYRDGSAGGGGEAGGRGEASSAAGVSSGSVQGGAGGKGGNSGTGSSSTSTRAQGGSGGSGNKTTQTGGNGGTEGRFDSNIRGSGTAGERGYAGVAANTVSSAVSNNYGTSITIIVGDGGDGGDGGNAGSGLRGNQPTNGNAGSAGSAGSVTIG